MQLQVRAEFRGRMGKIGANLLHITQSPLVAGGAEEHLPTSDSYFDRRRVSVALTFNNAVLAFQASFSSCGKEAFAASAPPAGSIVILVSPSRWRGNKAPGFVAWLIHQLCSRPNGAVWNLAAAGAAAGLRP